MQTILIVDDESHLTYILSAKLKAAGFVTLTADDGEEGFVAAKSCHPSLVVSDYQMPRMSGLEMCTRLKQDPQTASTPVIMLTARGHRVSDAEMAQTNIRALMAKPFSMQELIAKVKEVLGACADGAQAA